MGYAILAVSLLAVCGLSNGIVTAFVGLLIMNFI